MGTDNPLVSVIMTTYNHSKFIDKAISSVLNQTYQNLELIVIDDGSLDDTLEKVNAFQDKRMKIIAQKNAGPSIAFNNGLQIASGDWIAFMSGDDVCLPQRIEKQLAAALQNQEPCVVFSHVDVIDQDDHRVKISPLYNIFNRPSSGKRSFYLYKLVYEGNFFCAPTAFLSKSLFDKYGCLNPFLVQLQDFDFWLRLIKFVDFKIIETPLLQYRWHGSNLSFQTPEHQSLSQIEHKLILKTVFDDIPDSLFRETFLEHFKHLDYETPLERKCVEAILFLDIKIPGAFSFGIELLYKLAQNPESLSILKKRYSYDEKKILMLLKDSAFLGKDADDIHLYLKSFASIFKRNKKISDNPLLKPRVLKGMVLINIGFLFLIAKSLGEIIKGIKKKLTSKRFLWRQVDLETIDDFCKRKPENRIKMLSQGDSWEVVLPKICNEKYVKETHVVPVPDSWVAHLKDVDIIDAFCLYQKRSVIIYEPASYPHYGYHVSGFRDYMIPVKNNPKKIRLSYSIRKKFDYDSGILLSGRCSRNYYHWLIEYLPKFFEIDSQDDLKDIPLVIDPGMPEQHYQALELLTGGNRKYIFHDAKRISFFKSLVVPSISTYTPDNFDMPYWQMAAVSEKHLIYIRNKILSRLEKEFDTSKKYPEKVYLSRPSKGSRQMSNSKEVECFFLEKGFTIISPEKLSFKEQIAYIKNAKIIVGVSGASLSNLLFCQEKAEIIALTSNRNKEFCNFVNLAKINGADFCHFTGKNLKDRSKFLTEEEFVHSPFSISLQELRYLF